MRLQLGIAHLHPLSDNCLSDIFFQGGNQQVSSLYNHKYLGIKMNRKNLSILKTPKYIEPELNSLSV